MFERYTLKARRVIYFARLEASTYGNRHIDTEHLLLGILRESPALLKPELGSDGGEAEIRTEIEKFVEKGEPLPTSIETPLTKESVIALSQAAKEADALGHKLVGSAHLLLAVCGMGNSRAARALKAKGVKLQSLRDRLVSEMRNSVEEDSIE